MFTADATINLFKIFPEIDAAINGEGELPLSRLIAYLNDPMCKKIPTVKGIITAESSEKKTRPAFHQMNELSDLVPPDYDDYFELLKSFGPEKIYDHTPEKTQRPTPDTPPGGNLPGNLSFLHAAPVVKNNSYPIPVGCYRQCRGFFKDDGQQKADVPRKPQLSELSRTCQIALLNLNVHSAKPPCKFNLSDSLGLPYQGSSYISELRVRSKINSQNWDHRF